MNQTEIWKFAQQNAFYIKKGVCSELLYLNTKEFQKIKLHFIPEKNFLHKEESLRTPKLFKHIHAIQFGDIYMLHFDFGNPARNIFLAIPHFFVDVIPDLPNVIFSTLKGKNPWSLTKE